MDSKKNDNRLTGYIVGVVVLLMAVGAVFVFSSDVNLTKGLTFENFYQSQGLRQLLFFPLGVLVMHLVSLFDYHRLGSQKGWPRSPISYLLGASIALLVLVLFPGIGTEVNYARRWLIIPAGPVNISFQPSELAKWMVIIFICAYCDRYRNDLGNFTKRFLPVCVVMGVASGLVLVEDFGTAAFIALLGFVLLIIAGVKWWHILTPLPAAGAAFAFAVLSSPTRMQRISAFLNPDKWTQSANYQANQSLIALGSGGVMGKGLGRGICKYGHLPEDTTDFIFAIIGEELGLCGTLGVILLFLVFVWLGILVVVRSRDRLGQLLAAGIVLAISIQAAINIGVVTVVLPTKGIPLPFVSAGGTSMLLSAASVGILLNIARQSPKLTKQEQSNE